MDYAYQSDFVHVFGFNWNKAAAYFGVHRRTILRWYEGQPPNMVKHHIAVMARGYLPDYAPFSSWRIEGQDIYTPNGKVSALDVEFARAYKWQARELESHFKQRSTNRREMLEAVERIVQESEELKLKLRRVI